MKKSCVILKQSIIVVFCLVLFALSGCRQSSPVSSCNATKNEVQRNKSKNANDTKKADDFLDLDTCPAPKEKK